MDKLTEIALAEAILVDGFDAHGSALAELLDRAHHYEADEVLLSILSDGRSPRVARERALGRVIVFMEYRRRKHREHREDSQLSSLLNGSRPLRPTRQRGTGFAERPSDQIGREQTELALCK